MDGEVIKEADPEVGFIHRGIEKIGENRMYFKLTPVVNKLDYIAAAAWEHCYTSCVEHLMGIDPPERAVWARMMMLELQRIVSHLFWLGTLAMDLGQPTVFVWAMREREKALDIFEHVMGGRMTFGWMIIGGLRDDITRGHLEMIREFLDYLEGRLPEYFRVSEQNGIFRKRLQGVGVIPVTRALAHGLTGPVLRASGIPYDVRKDAPYLAYDKVDFSVVTRRKGDNYARYEVRRDEIFESIKVVRQVLERLPKGPVRAVNAATLHPPIALSMKTPEDGRAFVRNECPRGEGVTYLLSDGSNYPYRVRFRGPSFTNLCIIPELFRGMTIPDMVATLATLDPVFGECDR